MDWHLIEIAAVAGGALEGLRRLRQQVNGLGRRVRERDDLADARHLRTSLALQLVAPDDKKIPVADLTRH
jgi:hypothetical protein